MLAAAASKQRKCSGIVLSTDTAFRTAYTVRIARLEKYKKQE